MRAGGLSQYCTSRSYKLQDVYICTQPVAIEQFQNHGNQKLRNGPHPNRHVFIPDCLLLLLFHVAS